GQPLIPRDRLDHQQPFRVREWVRLRQVAQQIARLLAHAPRIGVRDADEHVVALCRCAAEGLEMAVVEGLEPSMDHAVRHYWTTTPAPSSTRPIRRMNKRFAENAASSAAPWSAGSDTRRPPAVCGSKPSASSVELNPLLATRVPAKSRFRG